MGGGRPAELSVETGEGSALVVDLAHCDTAGELHRVESPEVVLGKELRRAVQNGRCDRNRGESRRLIPGAEEIGIVVPNGASCRLEGTRIDGNVRVGSGSKLTALGVRVDGNIQADGHAAVTVAPLGGAHSFVGGNIQLERGGASRIDATTIDGNLQVGRANGAQIANGNVIDGDLQPFGNRGGFEIRSNRIDGNLQCNGNLPAPHGGDNAVSGDREGQCANLVPRPPSEVPGPGPAPGGPLTSPAPLTPMRPWCCAGPVHASRCRPGRGAPV